MERLRAGEGRGGRRGERRGTRERRFLFITEYCFLFPEQPCVCRAVFLPAGKKTHTAKAVWVRGKEWSVVSDACGGEGICLPLTKYIIYCIIYLY